MMLNARLSLFSLVLVSALIIGGLALASTRRMPSEDGARLSSAQPLPHDWVWKKKAINFDDMYRRR